MLTACFYGDDFTGSTDALAQFTRWGLRARLLLGLPDEKTLEAQAEGVDVMGIAGVARSLAPTDMDAEVRPILESLARLCPRVVQYKCCSTFDSAPHVGSIGRAVELGREVFGPAPVTVAPAQPEFGRYTVFGNHFAAYADRAWRLDRHPTMAAHPSTPMDEADLRLVLGRQARLDVELFDLHDLHAADAADRYRRLAAPGPAAIVFDALEQDDLRKVASLTLSGAGGEPVFVVGSGGLSHGIGAAAGRAPTRPRPIPPAELALVLSGSCARQTADQIRWAAARGWAVIEMAPGGAPEPAAESAIAALRTGRSAIVCTAVGPPPAGAPPADARAVGDSLGRVARRTLEVTPVRRLVICGGDTAGFLVRGLGAESLELVGQLAVAAPLCRLAAPGSPFDGIELLLKGGQVGPPDLFQRALFGN